MIHEMKPLKICFPRFILCHPFNLFSSVFGILLECWLFCLDRPFEIGRF